MNVGVSIECGSAGLVVRPNRSLPVTGMAILFAVVTLQAAAIGVGFALVGAWMVLPFTGVEIAVVAWLCHWLYHHRDDCELVTLGLDAVSVTKRQGKQISRADFPRYWTRVILDDSSRAVRLGSHGRYVTLGDYINDGDRALLAKELKRLLAG